MAQALEKHTLIIIITISIMIFIISLYTHHTHLEQSCVWVGPIFGSPKSPKNHKQLCENQVNVGGKKWYFQTKNWAARCNTFDFVSFDFFEADWWKRKKSKAPIHHRVGKNSFEIVIIAVLIIYKVECDFQSFFHWNQSRVQAQWYSSKHPVKKKKRVPPIDNHFVLVTCWTNLIFESNRSEKNNDDNNMVTFTFS